MGIPAYGAEVEEADSKVFWEDPVVRQRGPEAGELLLHVGSLESLKGVDQDLGRILELAVEPVDDRLLVYADPGPLAARATQLDPPAESVDRRPLGGLDQVTPAALAEREVL